MERREQALLLEPERVQDLVVPEQVATRLLGLGDDQVGQADGLGALDVKFGQDLDARPPGVIFEQRLGKLTIERRIDDHSRPWPLFVDCSRHPPPRRSRSEVEKFREPASDES